MRALFLILILIPKLALADKLYCSSNYEVATGRNTLTQSELDHGSNKRYDGIQTFYSTEGTRFYYTFGTCIVEMEE